MAKWIFGGIGLIVLLSIILFTCGIVGKGCNQAVKATHIDDAVSVYEEFQEIYNTCDRINTDLCNMRATNENDKMFEQFSKSQRILTLQTSLNRWVNEYNAKSKMWGRALWKSKKLPFELSLETFDCYNNKN